MPRKRKTDVQADKQVASKTTFKPENGFSEFVRLELTKEQRQELKVYMQSDGFDAWALLDEILDYDYRVTFRFEQNNDCYAAYMSTCDKTHVNGGLTLTGRGGSYEMALAELAYKHSRILKGDWVTNKRPQYEKWWEQE